MKVLILGAGRMAGIRAEDLAGDPRVSELMISNRNLIRAKELAERHGARAVEWSEVPNLEPDAVVVAVGTDGHVEALDLVFPMKVPVLIEKPIAETVEQTQQVIAKAAEVGVALQVGFQRRFDPNFVQVREAIASGAIGTLYCLRIASHDHTPSAPEFIAGSGGIFRDLHVHDFDLVRWLTGSEVATVFATKTVRLNQDYARFDDGDVSSISLVTESGIPVIISGTRHNPLGHDVRIEAYGSADSLSAGLNHRTPLRAVEADLNLNADPYQGFIDRFRESFRNETASFVAFAGGEISNPCPPEAALESLRIAAACEASVSSGQAVRVAEVAD
ncbi:MAG: hypothetical protein RL670_650 [Actinomycetota bacterium]